MDLTNDALADMAVTASAMIAMDTVTTNKTEDNMPMLLTESSPIMTDEAPQTLVWKILHHGRWAFVTASLCLVALWSYCMASGPLLTGANHYHWISQDTYKALAVPSLALWFISIGCGILLVPLTGCFVWMHMVCCSRQRSPRVRSLLEESQLDEML